MGFCDRNCASKTWTGERLVWQKRAQTGPRGIGVSHSVFPHGRVALRLFESSRGGLRLDED